MVTLWPIGSLCLGLPMEKGKKKRSWLRLTGIGCGGLLLLGIGMLGVTWIQYWVLSGQAVETLEQLEGSYPTQSDFTPPIDDAIPSDRLERFVAVRRALYPLCSDFTALKETFDNMEQRVERLEGMDEEAAKGEMKELLGEGGTTLKSMLTLGRNLARFSIARNEALMDNGLGLGEYTWIYVITYYSWLGHSPHSFPVAKEERPRIFHDRVLGEVREMARRHLEQLDSPAVSSGSEPPEERRRRLATWRDEVEALFQDPARIPFQDGLPAAIAESLSPHREDLESLFCAQTGELEIMRTRKSTIRYDHD